MLVAAGCHRAAATLRLEEEVGLGAVMGRIGLSLKAGHDIKRIKATLDI